MAYLCFASPYNKLVLLLGCGNLQINIVQLLPVKLLLDIWQSSTTINSTEELYNHQTVSIFNYKVNIFRNKKGFQQIELDESYRLRPYSPKIDPRKIW